MSLRFRIKRVNAHSLFLESDIGAAKFDSIGQPIDDTHANFAAWLALPIAMVYGRDLSIEGTGDHLVAANAARLSQVWETWLPYRYRSVAVKFDQYEDCPVGEGRLVLYSGGVDSTYNLLQHQARGDKPGLLTVHGLDYRYKDEARFETLWEKTRDFAAAVSSERIGLKTDIYDFYARHGVRSDIGHAFALAGALFMFASRYGAGEISADYSSAQDYLVHPWGTNSFTNPMFASSTFKFETACNDLTRSEKMSALAASKDALAALTFCKDYSKRPRNCGACSKCTRTKAMFLAATGAVPDIFIKPGFRPSYLKSIDLNKKSEGAFFVDLLLSARKNGNIEKIPGLEAKAERYFNRQRVKGLPLGKRLERLFRR